MKGSKTVRWLFVVAFACACMCALPTIAFAGTLESQSVVEVSDGDNPPSNNVDPDPEADDENPNPENPLEGDLSGGDPVQLEQLSQPQQPEQPVQLEQPGQESPIVAQTVVEANQATDTTKGETPEVDAPAPASSEDAITEQSTPSAPNAKLGVRAHVQNDGWQSWAYATSSGNTIRVGTMGRSLRLEEITFKLSGVSGGVQAQAHVQNIGWQGVSSSPGTHGQSLRIEALRIMLTGEASQWYDISYRAHVQNYGWMAWTSNGGIVGTHGEALRLEALEIKLTKKASQSSQSEGIVGVRAKGHVQNVGWQAWSADGELVGTTGESLRLEALQLQVNAGVYGGGIKCNAHVQNYGWRGYKTGTAGSTGEGLRMEAVRIQLTGKLANEYDVVYRAHVQNVGWQPWTVNGGTAGTTGKSLRVEALEIKLVKKNSSQGLSEGTYFITFATDPNKALSNTSASSGAQTKSAAYADNLAERYYLRKESGGTISLQSVNTGLFLASNGGKLVQLADSSSAAQRWKLSWNGGYTLTNSAGGAMALSGNKGTVTSGGSKMMLTGTTIIPDGTYVVHNNAADKVLEVKGNSLSNGANIQVANANNGGSQAFIFTRKSGNTYYIKNADSYMAVEVGNASRANGANVRQWTSNGSAAQQWTASMSRSGGLVFTNKGSGKVMTAAGSGKAGSNVNSSNNSNAATQRWHLASSSYKGDPVLSRALSIMGNSSSDTSYYIAVDLTNHRTMVFRGSAGNWSIDKNWTVSVGAPETPTVVGDYEIGSRGYSFGSGYTCYYWTQFYGDYLFHSVLYNQGTFDVQDGRLGYSISHGCIRMNIDNAEWIYDNVPSGTHVKTYY